MFDMDCDNLVKFLPCEGGVLPGVVFPGFFSKKFFIDLFSDLFRFHTKDCKRSLIFPNEMYGMQGFLKRDSLLHDAFSLTVRYMTHAKSFFQHESLFRSMTSSTHSIPHHASTLKCS